MNEMLEPILESIPIFGCKNGRNRYRISAEYIFLYIGRYKTLQISCQYKPQA